MADVAECPWSGWARPNLDWTEENLCGWIVEPANTWSNLAYLVAAVAILVQSHPPHDGAIRLSSRVFAGAVAFLGAASFAYHASATFVFQVLDFLGMYGVIGLPLALNAHRLGWIPRRRLATVHLGIVGVFLGLLFVLRALGWPYQGLVGLMVAGLLAQEARQGLGRRHRDFWWACLFLGAGGLFSWLDITRRISTPEDHLFQGHALWHLFSATALVFAYRHDQQRGDENRPAPGS